MYLEKESKSINVFPAARTPHLEAGSGAADVLPVGKFWQGFR